MDLALSREGIKEVRQALKDAQDEGDAISVHAIYACDPNNSSTMVNRLWGLPAVGLWKRKAEQAEKEVEQLKTNAERIIWRHTSAACLGHSTLR